MTKLEREWASRLKASGFRDLEGADKDGPLSNAGNLHAISETAHEHDRLASRMEDGEAYQKAARDLLWARRWPNATDRRVWEMHTNGSGLRDITATLDVSWARASKVLHDAQRRMTQVRQVTEGEKKCTRRKMQRLIRRADPSFLEKLAALLILTPC